MPHLDVVEEFSGYTVKIQLFWFKKLGGGLGTWSSASFGSGSASNSFTKFCFECQYGRARVG